MLKTRVCPPVGGLAALVIGLALLALPLSAKAFMVKTDQSINIPTDQVVDGNLYAAGNVIQVSGTVKGDVICAGQSVTINGAVEGDVICAGQSIDISGRVGGSVRVAGNTIKLNALIGRNAMVFGSTVSLTPQNQISWDLLIGAGLLDVNGKINGNLHGGTGQAVINGAVGRDVYLQVGSQKNVKGKQQSGLTLGDQAKVNGNLTYRALIDAQISDKAVVGGEIKRQEFGDKYQDDRNWAMAWVWSKIFGIFAALLIGLVLINLWRNKFSDYQNNLASKPWASLGWGLVVFFLAPLCALVLAITIIGWPLAAAIMLLWIIILLISWVILAVVLGQWILQKFNKPKASLYWSMILGVIVIQLIFAIPVFGWALCFLATLLGAGLLWQDWQKQLK